MMDYPEIGQRVLVVVDGDWEIATFSSSKGRMGTAWDFDTWGLALHEVEHWAPLPPLPEPAREDA